MEAHYYRGRACLVRRPSEGEGRWELPEGKRGSPQGVSREGVNSSISEGRRVSEGGLPGVENVSQNFLLEGDRESLGRAVWRGFRGDLSAHFRGKREEMRGP